MLAISTMFTDKKKYVIDAEEILRDVKMIIFLKERKMKNK